MTSRRRCAPTTAREAGTSAAILSPRRSRGWGSAVTLAAEMGLLDGKRALIVGVGNQRSIAWGIATAFQREGARLAFTYLNDRFKENVTKLIETLPEHESVPVVECDAAKSEHVARLMDEVGKRWDGLDVLVHSIAYAPTDDLRRPFHEISRDGVLTAVDVSAYTL